MEPGQLTLNSQRNNPYYMASCKAGHGLVGVGGRGGGEKFLVPHLFYLYIYNITKHLLNRQTC